MHDIVLDLSLILKCLETEVHLFVREYILFYWLEMTLRKWGCRMRMIINEGMLCMTVLVCVGVLWRFILVRGTVGFCVSRAQWRRMSVAWHSHTPQGSPSASVLPLLGCGGEGDWYLQQRKEESSACCSRQSVYHATLLAQITIM